VVNHSSQRANSANQRANSANQRANSANQRANSANQRANSAKSVHHCLGVPQSPSQSGRAAKSIAAFQHDRTHAI
jgi:hypothetical protein